MAARATRVFWAAAAFLAVLGFLPACAQESVWQMKQDTLAKAQEHYEAGKRYMQAGNYTAANDEFNRVEFLMQEAQSIYAEPGGARAQTQETSLPEDAEKKQMEKALSYYLKELKKETNNPSYYYNLGIEYLINGKFVQAEEAFKLVLNLDPLDKGACYNLGVLYENYLGNKEKALKYYQQYLNIVPDAPDAATVQGWITSLKEGTKK
jgi:tetratricopeptide (TPR) repeat protein